MRSHITAHNARATTHTREPAFPETTGFVQKPPARREELAIARRVIELTEGEGDVGTALRRR